MNIEVLYNHCLERVTLGDIEAGEKVLIKCITYLVRERTGRADHDRITEDVVWNRGMDKYLPELELIAKLDDQELSILVSNNFDATPVVNEAKRIYELVTTSNVQNKKEAKKILQAAKMFLSIAKIIGGLDYKVIKSSYTPPKRKIKKSRG